MAQKSRRVGLIWKFTGTIVGTITIFGVIVMGVVYDRTGRALREGLNEQASTVATNLSDTAAGYVVLQNALQLDALVTKYARLKGVAYAFIEDRSGKVIAHSFGTFPAKLQEPPSSKDLRKAHRREVRFEGRAVYETRHPILEGQLGAAHVGFWGDLVENEIRHTISTLMELIAVVLLAGVVLLVLLIRKMTQPILRLAQIADKIALGDLKTSVNIESHDEIGDLAHSLELTRLSLKLAMSQPGHGSKE